MNLLIVESPGKTKKVQDFLKDFQGSEWLVKASFGHIRDLPKKEMGVDTENFKPKYVPTDKGKSVIKQLSELAKKADSIYLATDPDREGEAIAWHLLDALKGPIAKKPVKRVTYTEITEKAVCEAVSQPRDIDMNLVAAQEGRRVLDRLVGYTVSPILSQSAGGNLSAGRVQSPALRLVVERERKIKDFKVIQHYGVELFFDYKELVSDGWKAVWLPKQGWLEPNQEYFLDQITATKIAALTSLKVVDCLDTENKTSPPAPFTTSSLQQAASNALKMSPKKTMEVAQKLYEEGLITYMRTDSPNLSAEAASEIRNWALQNDLPLPAEVRVFAVKKGAQEAHEAIRPTHVDVVTAGGNS